MPGEARGAAAGDGAAGSVALALGGGGARGLAQIVMLEALEELGLRPARIVGTSMGAIIGALNAAGYDSKAIRAVAEELFTSRAGVIQRLARSFPENLALWTPRQPARVDGAALLAILLPGALERDIETLDIPFAAVAADFFAMRQVVLERGPLIHAIAASAALPSFLQAVPHGDSLLIDGGFVNPTPFDLIAGSAATTVAVDVTGAIAARSGNAVPSAFEASFGATQIMFRMLVEAKRAVAAPDVFIRPDVGAFGTLEFLRWPDILHAAAPAKEELKRQLAARIENVGTDG